MFVESENYFRQTLLFGSNTSLSEWVGLMCVCAWFIMLAHGLTVNVNLYCWALAHGLKVIEITNVITYNTKKKYFNWDCGGDIKISLRLERSAITVTTYNNTSLVWLTRKYKKKKIYRTWLFAFVVDFVLAKTTFFPLMFSKYI